MILSTAASAFNLLWGERFTKNFLCETEKHMEFTFTQKVKLDKRTPFQHLSVESTSALCFLFGSSQFS